MIRTPRNPPLPTNYKGKPREVGVEIEFATLSAESAAYVVRDIFGGRISKIDAHRYTIESTELGDFRSELDSHYVHCPGFKEPIEEESVARMFEEFQQGLRTLLGNVSALVVPCEIVCPPVRIVDLARVDKLVSALRNAGAAGTRHNLLYAFGAQLNPDIAQNDARYIASVLKAYLLSSEWLRTQIQVDITRRIFAFADPFPIDYALLVTDPGYWPNTDQLIDDYLSFNPTRNRELDLLPLFMWLDEERILTSVPDHRIKKRPTFHYRLPDAQFGDPNWNIIQEWNRWCAVEYLAENKDRLAEMAHAFHDNKARVLPEAWADRAGQWIDFP